jgi:hypothetical protein
MQGWTTMRVERSPNIRSGAFCSTSTNGDPCLLIEEVTRRGDDFRRQGMKRGSYFPLLLIFILLLLLIS